jgi:hypothetical protein
VRRAGEGDARDAVQGELFALAPVVLRHVASSGATFRLRLVPVGDGLVRVVAAERRAPGATTFKSVPSEIGRVVRFEQLGLADAYESVFGPETGTPPC